MLAPQDRRLLYDILRPPSGYELDAAICTTYTLDLLTLLTAPLGFTLFDWQEEDGLPTADPVALLEAIRRNAERLAIFCEAGRITVPPRHHQLFGYLEGSVVPVKPPHPDGVFHPKVWVIRMLGPDAHVRYRVICLSRNLTPDRSWDATLVLDGELLDRERGISANHPLADFVGHLPELALDPVSERIRKQVGLLADDLRKVDFELPENFEEYAFWPLGIPGYRRWPFPSDADCGVVVAPFIAPSTLARLGKELKGQALVSRADELMKIHPDALSGFRQVYTLAPSIEAEVASEESVEAGQALTGLHAKIYVADQGGRSSVWVGSANATDAAFARNVEFLVELVGAKKRCGTAALLAHGTGAAGFLDLLQPYTPAEPVAVDAVAEKLEELLEAARRTIARARLSARAELAEDGRYRLTLLGGTEPITLPDSVTGAVWPLSLSRDSYVRPADLSVGSLIADFGPVAVLSLTSLFGFAVRARYGGREDECEFVLNLPLHGAPDSRREAILRSLLDDRSKVLRFLLFLLGLEDSSASGDAGIIDWTSTGQPVRPGSDSMPLLEVLLRALDRDPRRLDQVSALVRDLCATAEGEQLLPERFQEVWGPIWKARQNL